MTFNPCTKKAVTGAAKGRMYQRELEAQIDELVSRLRRAEAAAELQADAAAVAMAKIKTQATVLAENSSAAGLVAENILREIARWEGSLSVHDQDTTGPH